MPSFESNVTAENVAARFAHYDDVLICWLAPRRVRPTVRLLLALEARLREVARVRQEPLLADIKLAWWREQLMALDMGAVPNEPLLQKVATMLVPPLTGASLGGLTEDEQREAVFADALVQICGAPAHQLKPLILLNILRRHDTNAVQQGRPLASPAWRTLIALRIALIRR